MVKTRTRLLIALLLFFGLGLYLLIKNFQDDVLPRYKETMEESMVDMSVLLAAQISNQIVEQDIPVDALRAAFNTAKKQPFIAQIYELTKTQLNMRVYVTDRNGIVLFDSDSGKDEGKDYSQWNDVYRTLQGKYGSRSSRSNPDDPLSSLLCVAAPIKVKDDIVGVLTVCKPTASIQVFLEMAQWDVMALGVVASLALLLIALLTSFWITWPIEKLTQYVHAIRHGERITAPRLGRSEIGALGSAFEEMRVALEGRKYVEEYVQALTHQMKSPLSAIRGAAELLGEDMPIEERRRFTKNICSESARIQDIIDRMLHLSALENRRQLQNVETVNIAELLSDILENMQPVFSDKNLNIQLVNEAPTMISCEVFLVRQAVCNLLQNAADFSHIGGSIVVSTRLEKDHLVIMVEDTGYGIPDYARDKVFDRFYSLQRPESGKSSSGLGLAFVREVAALHGGEASVENRPNGSGVVAILTLALNPSPSTF